MQNKKAVKFMVYFGYFGNRSSDVINKWTIKVSNFFEKDNICKCIDKNFSYGVVDSTIFNQPSSTTFIDGFCLFADSVLNLSNFNDVIFDRLLKCNCKEFDLCGSFTAFKKYKNEVKFINDYYSARPLYYYCNGQELFFSNDIVMLILLDDIPFSVNKFACELYCSSWFTIEENSLGEYTFFEKIKKLPPASVLSFDGKKLSLFNYYDLEKISSLNYSKISDLSYHLKALRNSLNKISYATYESSKCPNVGVSLSGGIDSSVVLASLISCGLKENIICYHLAFKDPTLYHVSDHEIVKELITHTKVKSYIIWGDKSLKINNCELGRDPFINANGPCCISNELFYFTISGLMRKNNSEILFGGDGGDYLFMGTKYCGDYYMRSKNFRKAFSRSLYLSQSQSIFSKFKNIMKSNIFPFIPFVCDYSYLRIFWKEIFEKTKTPEYMGNIVHTLNKRIQSKKFMRFNESKILKYWYRRFVYDFMFPKGEYVDTRLNDIYVYQPLMDNKIFLQILTTPPDLHYNIYDTSDYDYFKRKKLLRYAYQDILPNCIINQPEKTNYSAVIGSILRNERANLLKLFSYNNTLLTDELGLIKKRDFCNKIKNVIRYSEDPHYFFNEETNYYMNIIKLEIWLKFVDKGKSYFLESLKKSRKMKNNFDDVEFIN